jgi:Response regulator containing a CheY-like receiver domain and an HTH DNA-binding domain
MTVKHKKVIKVILVDDNEYFRGTLKKFLEYELQYEVIDEYSSAKMLLESNNYCMADVILMDLQMPGMDGFVAAKNILLNCRHVPILAVTMYAEKAYLEELINVGFKGCVFKSEIFRNLGIAINELVTKKYFFPNEIKL